eukprot:CFRG4425T1
MLSALGRKRLFGQLHMRSFRCIIARSLASTASSPADVQHAIISLGSQPMEKIDVHSLLSFGNVDSYTYRTTNAQYLQRSLPMRMAHRIKDFQSLPFIVGCNPAIKSVYDLQVHNFDLLRHFPEITTIEEEKQFLQLVTDLLNQNVNVVNTLARGFGQCKHHMPTGELTRFLNGVLTSRIAVRLLVEHFIALHERREGFKGIVCEEMNPALAVEKAVGIVSGICEQNYGVAPPVVIDGHTKATIPYIPAHLDYMLIELLKNAFRAVCEANRSAEQLKDEPLPPIEISVCKGESDFFIRIRDQGGGMPKHVFERIMEYSFTTAHEYMNELESGGISLTTQNPTGPMAGLGFGLPMSRVYAEYFGGALDMYTMPSYGTDIFLRIPIDLAGPTVGVLRGYPGFVPEKATDRSLEQAFGDEQTRNQHGTLP